jgi:hypothetical protein
MTFNEPCSFEESWLPFLPVDPDCEALRSLMVLTRPQEASGGDACAGSDWMWISLHDFVCLHETDFVDHLLIGMRADRMYEVMAWMNFLLRYVKFDDFFHPR